MGSEDSSGTNWQIKNKLHDHKLRRPQKDQCLLLGHKMFEKMAIN